MTAQEESGDGESQRVVGGGASREGGATCMRG